MTEAATHRVGDFLPGDQAVVSAWLGSQIARAEREKKEKKDFLPVIREFQDFIEGDPAVFMLFDQMFKQVHHHMNPAHECQVKDYRVFLSVLDQIMTSAPEFNETGVVGFPINAILDWSMGTTSGYAAFLMEKVNAHLKTVLDEWGVFLTTKHSVSVLNGNKDDEHDKDGWLSDAAFEMMAPDCTQDPRQWFIDTFVCEPDKPYFGFTSWDDFFRRELRDGARPVAKPDDSGVIANACESAPFNYAFNVDRCAQFWIKGQPYSLEHMMAHDPLVDKFVSGTIYQAFLSAGSYHRWHSPVTGTIAKAYVIPGTYYSESLINRKDPAGPNNSQGYITAVAARALIFIEADDPQIGLMCVMPVGMAEVSTCQITVYEGQHVEKGDQIGTFRYGGSTHCLFFRPEAKIKLDLHGITPYERCDPKPKTIPNIPINSQIATVC